MCFAHKMENERFLSLKAVIKIKKYGDQVRGKYTTLSGLDHFRWGSKTLII